MKIRNGFVSNSSSSSFIIGVGKIVDMDKFTDFCVEKNINKNDIETYTTEELKNKKYFPAVRNGKLVYESFDGSQVSTPFDETKDEIYLVVYTANDIIEDEDGDTNYDIDIDSFDDNQQELLSIGEDVGVTNYDYTFGAGRNG